MKPETSDFLDRVRREIGVRPLGMALLRQVTVQTAEISSSMVEDSFDDFSIPSEAELNRLSPEKRRRVLRNSHFRKAFKIRSRRGRYL